MRRLPPSRPGVRRRAVSSRGEHHHGGLGLHTPAEVHYDLAAAKAADRADVLNTTRSAHPERFSTPAVTLIPG